MTDEADSRAASFAENSRGYPVHPTLLRNDVPARIEFSGGIESICQESAALTAGMTAKIVFKTWDDVTPPVTIKVKGPDGKILLDRVMRELPTGSPQSAAPITFLVPATGIYQIHVKELYGQVEGTARLTVS